jgi:hypothetical protein
VKLALTDCRECGKQVSTRAVTCPNCGSQQAGASKATAKSKPKGTRWWFLLVAIAVAALAQPMLQKVPQKSALMQLCEEEDANYAKFTKYWGEGNVDFAADVSRELKGIQAKLAAYKPEELAKACGRSVQTAVPKGVVAQTKPATNLAEQPPIPDSGKGCKAPPSEVLPFGKPLNISELSMLMSRACRTSVISPNSPVEVQWEEKTYQVGFMRSPGNGSAELYEISSIRAR